MQGSVVALAAVLTFGVTGLGMQGMAREFALGHEQGIVAAAPRVTPGPAGQIWDGGTLPAITVQAQAYSAVVMAIPEPVLAVPHRRA